MAPLIDAYDTRTGLKRRVPRAWVGHPKLGRHLSAEPPTTAAAPPARGGTPDESWTVPQLRSHATSTGVDLTGATTKAEILSALSTPPGGENTEH